MWQKNVHYLDYNASSGIDARVKKGLIEILSDESRDWANPSSRHRLGQKQQAALSDAAYRVAGTLSSKPSQDQIVFTSSGTEANQTILRTLARTCDHLIVGAGEHSASYDLVDELSATTLPLLPSGGYDLQALESQLNQASAQGKKRVGLSLFWVNNETGFLTAMPELARVITGARIEVRLHLDACQAWGKIEIDMEKIPADYLSFSSQKIGAPAGTGLIYRKKDAEIHPLLKGSQAFGLRGGTENSLGIIALGMAASLIDPAAFQAHTRPLIQHLEERLKNEIPAVVVFSDPSSRISNTLRFGIAGFKSYENWVELLDLKGFAVSHGSACKSRVVEPSRVLLEMGASTELALNSVRVSIGPRNTREEMDSFVDVLSELVRVKGGAA